MEEQLHYRDMAGNDTVFNKESFKAGFKEMHQLDFGKTFESCSNYEHYKALVRYVCAIANQKHKDTVDTCVREGKKSVYYFSLEFLIGRLLDDYLCNFGMREAVAEGLQELGCDLDELLECEPDAALGNGGLGRLAACFLDSMAHEGVVGVGNGMRYKYGLFKQVIEGGQQVEKPDDWLARGFAWERRFGEQAVIVHFGGKVNRHEENGRYWFTWDDTEDVKAVPYEVPIVGYGGKTVNSLRIWRAESVEEVLDLDAFNAGDYAKAYNSRAEIDAISTVLYPNDAGYHGRILRLKQEYLFVAAGLSRIVTHFKDEHGADWDNFGNYVAIHTNDTHPAMCGAELMRILVDEEGLDWDSAWRAVQTSVSFTNHTVLPEAHEKWSIDLFRRLLPRVYNYIEEIDRRYRESFPKDIPNWQDKLRATAILWDGQVRMANLSIICSYSVNGVAQLHTDILKREVFKEFYELFPEKFINITNGVSHRRFLAEANPSYAQLITEKIGGAWLDDATEFERLKEYEDDEEFLDAFLASKQANKERLAAYIAKTTGVELDPTSLFDVQVKRFHAYKRQLLNVFKILDIYHRLLTDPNYHPQPTSFIFSGKAAQSYEFAKEVIRLVNSVAHVINNDERVNKIIKVAFVPNFAVSNAQLIYAAADISEQISTAGQEASGTSNMKLMMNGALTLGTYDGANIEIAQLVGEENIKIFGLREEEVQVLQHSGTYFAWDEYYADQERLGFVVDALTDGSLAELSGNFERILDGLMMQNDHDLVLKDFRSYVDAWDELTATYADRRYWAKRAVHNTACSGFFASDRSIREYAEDIWHA